MEAINANICWQIFFFIIHHTHCGKSDWSRAFNQFTIACELDIINASFKKKFDSRTKELSFKQQIEDKGTRYHLMAPV